jgi:transcriptional regulator with PAS, ATPase and Fis domain
LVRKTRQDREAPDPFIGASPAIQSLAEHAHKVLSSESPILLLGETGTGKGVLAKWIHQNGPRADEPFVDLNCAGLSKEFLETELFGHEKGAFTGAVASKPGLLEVAHRGVVFLDEIGDMDPSVQPKLLKSLEEKRIRRMGDVNDRRVDIHLIAATHLDLALAVREKTFRSDLYFRINTIPLTIPPLRERREDIPLLARDLLKRLSTDVGRGPFELSEDAKNALRQHAWPGNIRELRNILERAILLSDQSMLLPRHLRFDSHSLADPITTDTSLTLVEMEQRYIEQVLAEEKGHVDQAARRLGVPRSSLYQKIKKYGIRES